MAQAAPNYNLSDLTVVAVKTVREATELAKDGYRPAVKEALDNNSPWTKGWFSEGICQGLYYHGLKAQDGFKDLQTYLADGIDRICLVAGYVGIGLAVARTGAFSEELYAQLLPEDRSWVFDGAGCWKLMETVKPVCENVPLPEYLAGDAERENAFDAGMGRGLWFYLGEGKLDQLIAAVESFPEQRRAAIWRGVGFASTYAGGSKSALSELKEKSGDYVNHLQLGGITAVLEQGPADIEHRQTAAQAYVGKSIAEIFERVTAAGLCEAHGDALKTKPTSVAWSQAVLSAVLG